MNTHTNADAECMLLDMLLAEQRMPSPSPVFILGSPRTGSTVLYQALCSRLSLPYISNLTNDLFSTTPIVGFAIQKSMPVEIDFNSHYGKTSGPLQPSEGSTLMRYWFGSGCPSAIKSAQIRDGLESHFLTTLRAAEVLFSAPLVIKNAWNCFRVPYLAKAVSSARFIWIRRDIAAAAKSDLAARYHTKGAADAWNSATPANIEKLLEMPPTAQVVENQHEFNTSIKKDLQSYATDRWYKIWYEDFISDPDKILGELALFLNTPVCTEQRVNINSSGMLELPSQDNHLIEEYIRNHSKRLSHDRYPKLSSI